jgi:uncharacterized protein
MSERSEYTPGEFGWVDLATPDIDAAKSFYGELIGWDAEAAPAPPEETGGYGYFTFKGKPVAGYGPTMGEGQPPAWSSYVYVSDATETAKKVGEAGGTVVMEPFEVPGDSGRMAVCQDPQGAFFSIFEPRQFQGAQLVNEIGAWTWNNLITRDADQAKDFYGNVFGWEATHHEEAPPEVLMGQVEGQRWPEGLGGMLEMGGDIPLETPPHWQVYFLVPDLDSAIEQVKGSGGNLLFGPQEVPVGTFAVFTDPQGAAFALMEPDYPEPR